MSQHCKKRKTAHWRAKPKWLVWMVAEKMTTLYWNPKPSGRDHHLMPALNMWPTYASCGSFCFWSCESHDMGGNHGLGVFPSGINGHKLSGMQTDHPCSDTQARRSACFFFSSLRIPFDTPTYEYHRILPFRAQARACFWLHLRTSRSEAAMEGCAAAALEVCAAAPTSHPQFLSPTVPASHPQLL